MAVAEVGVAEAERVEHSALIHAEPHWFLPTEWMDQVGSRPVSVLMYLPLAELGDAQQALEVQADLHFVTASLPAVQPTEEAVGVVGAVVVIPKVSRLNTSPDSRPVHCRIHECKRRRTPNPT